MGLFSKPQRTAPRVPGSDLWQDATRTRWGRRLLRESENGRLRTEPPDEAAFRLRDQLARTNSRRTLAAARRWVADEPLWAQLAPDKGDGPLVVLARNHLTSARTLESIYEVVRTSDTPDWPDDHPLSARRRSQMPARALAAVVSNPSTPAGLIAHALDDPRTPPLVLRIAVSAWLERDLSARRLLPLAPHDDDTVRVRLAWGLCDHQWHDDPATLRTLAVLSRDDGWMIRQQVARGLRCGCRVDLIDALADDETDEIRVTVAHNPVIGGDIVDKLRSDSKASVRWAAAQRQERDATPVDVDALASDGDRHLRARAVREYADRLTDDQLVALAGDRSVVVRRAVAAADRTLPAAAVDELLDAGSDEETLDALAERSELSDWQTVAVWALLNGR